MCHCPTSVTLFASPIQEGALYNQLTFLTPMTQLATTASDVNVEVLMTAMVNDIDQQLWDIFKYHLASMTDDEVDGVAWQNMRDELFEKVSERMVISFK